MKTYLMIFCIAVFLSSCSTNINCPAGYTGENCNIPFNEKYNGFMCVIKLVQLVVPLFII